MPDFEIVGGIAKREVIASGVSVRASSELREKYGGRKWRKCKGEATIALPDGSIERAELHWYEAHGVGRRRMKVKEFLD